MTETGSLSEKDYYTLSERNRFKKAEDGIYGRLKIYEVLFEYRSRVFYIMAGRFVARRGKAESDLLKNHHG